LLTAALVAGMTFTSENSTPLALTLFGAQLPELSVGLWLVIALFIGAIVGLLISLLPLFFRRYANTSKDKKILKLETELNKLRVSGLKG
jgi:uncharacterized integral membrane protein